jgi:hypothetical protein
VLAIYLLKTAKGGLSVLIFSAGYSVTAGGAAHPVGPLRMVLPDVAGEPLLLHLSPSLPTLILLSCLRTRGPSYNAR